MLCRQKVLSSPLTPISNAGCKRGETPGEGLRKVIKDQLESARDKESLRSARREGKVGHQEDVTVKALHRLSMLVAVKVGENVGVQFTDIHPSESIKLIRGSAYGEDKNAVLTSKPLPNLGYFEMVNKSKEFFCIKVLRKGGDQKFEVPRPSYIAGTVRLFCFCPRDTLITLLYLIALRYICSPCISRYIFKQTDTFSPFTTCVPRDFSTTGWICTCIF